jgi:NAD-dependent dihydropyrimidine dehydrogenase PreA subunit
MNGRQQKLPAVSLFGLLAKGFRSTPFAPLGPIPEGLRLGSISLYRSLCFLLECAVRRVAVVVKYLHRFQETHNLMTYVIAEPCINTKDTACVDACPVDCIHPKKDDPKYATEPLLYIDPVECIDCGACVPVCPVSAIFALDDLPEKWNEFTAKNAAYFGR